MSNKISEIYMYPITVTSPEQMTIVSGMVFPKVVTCIPFGIHILVTPTAVYYYENNKLNLVTGEGIYTELFEDLVHTCYHNNRTISAIIIPTNINISDILRELVNDKIKSFIKKSDVDIILLDCYSKINSSEAFSRRLERLNELDEEISDSFIHSAIYDTISSYDQLIKYTKTKLIEDKNSSILVRTPGSLFIDTTIWKDLIIDLRAYTSYFQLGCNMLFKGEFSNMYKQEISTLPHGSYSLEKIPITTRFEVKWNNKKITILLSNILFNVNEEYFLTIRALFLKHLNSFKKSNILFTGFSASTTDIEAPIGATFLRFNKLNL